MPAPSGTINVLLMASTFPAGDNDAVPSFVRDMISAVAERDSSFRVTVLAPHQPGVSVPGLTAREHFDEYRFRYVLPSSLQRLTGTGGIGPALTANPLRLAQVPLLVIAEFFTLLRVIARTKPDVINAHWVIPQGLVAALATRWRHVPLVISVNGGDVFSFDGSAARRVKRWAFARSSRIVAISSATAEKISTIDPSLSTTIIPMGVDPSAYRTERSLRSTPLRVLFVGRLSAEKGVDTLLSALALLAAQGRTFEARIAGTGPERDHLEALAGEHGFAGSVSFLGWVARGDLPEHFAWADVFVGPSRQSKAGWVEALGVVFVEAAASGLPVIATNLGGIRDIVKHGETGYLVDPDAPGAVAEGLARLDDDRPLGLRLGGAAIDHAVQNFSWESISRRYADVFRHVAATATAREDG